MRAVNKLIVKPDKAKEVSEGGIIIPEKAQDPPISGIILKSPLESFPEGQRVWYPNYVVVPVRLEGFGDVHLIPPDEVFLIDKVTDNNNKVTE